jgi:MFS family permease
MLPPTIRRDLSKAEIKPSGKVWTEGTLTYTGVGLAMLFFWLLWGDFSWAMKDRGVSPVATLLFKKYSASDFLVGMLLVSIPMLLSMLAGPIVSYKSDRHRGRFGRRIPFLLVQTPIAALAMVGLAFSPFLGKLFHATLGAFSPGQDGSVLFFVGTFWVVFNVTSIVANTIFQGLINDVVPREMLGRFFGAFRAVSLIAGMIFNRWIFAKAETGYFWIFLGMAALYGGGFISMCLKVKEGNYPPPPPPDPNRGVLAFLTASKGYLKECFGKPYFLWFFAALNFSWLAFIPINTYVLFYMKDLHMDLQTYGNCSVLSFFFSLVLTYPLGSLADRFHPLRTGMVIQGIYILVCLGSGLLVHDAGSFAIAIVLNSVVAGAWMTAVASIAQKLLPRNNFTQIASAGAILGSVTNIMVPPLVGLFLDHHHHNYRYTFYISGFIAIAALLTSLVLHQKFMQLGGPKNYVAPE